MKRTGSSSTACEFEKGAAVETMGRVGAHLTYICLITLDFKGKGTGSGGQSVM